MNNENLIVNNPAPSAPVSPTTPTVGNVLEWEAPVRPFHERSQEWFKVVAVIVVLVSLVAIFLREFLLLGVVFALAFVSYVLSTVPPQKVRHRISDEGISFGGTLYTWIELTEFYFSDLEDERALFVVTKKRFPSLLIMLLGGVSEEAAKNLLEKHLKVTAAPREDWMARSAHWLSSKIGLD